MSGEALLYKPIRKALLEAFKPIGECGIFITANRIREIIKQILPDYAVLIMKIDKFRPDLMGAVRRKKSSENPLSFLRTIAVEVKVGKLKFEDIYQVKRYAEVLSVNYALLIGNERFDEARRRFLRKHPTILEFHVIEDDILKSRPITVLEYTDGGELRRDQKISLLDPFDPDIPWS